MYVGVWGGELPSEFEDKCDSECVGNHLTNGVL